MSTLCSSSITTIFLGADSRSSQNGDLYTNARARRSRNMFPKVRRGVLPAAVGREWLSRCSFVQAVASGIGAEDGRARNQHAARPACHRQRAAVSALMPPSTSM